jgi:hypothetical protein
MTEQTVAPPEPTPFGAAVMDLCLERGVGNPTNLRPLRDDQHKALEDHFSGVRNHEHQDLCLDVALAFGLNPDNPATARDAQDLMRLSMSYTFGELAGAAL